MLIWTSLPGIIGGIISVYNMYESPRYLLLAKNKFEDGIRIIEFMIKKNNMIEGN